MSEKNKKVQEKRIISIAFERRKKSGIKQRKEGGKKTISMMRAAVTASEIGLHSTPADNSIWQSTCHPAKAAVIHGCVREGEKAQYVDLT